ncbi:MAG: sialidase family protein [Pseudomonadota bacterium]
MTIFLSMPRHALAAFGLAALAAHATAATAPYAGNAFAPDGTLWSVQLDAQGRLAVHRSADDGRHWLPPLLLDTAGDPIKTSGEGPPKILFGPQGLVLISYSRPLAQKYAAEIRLLRSTDGGAHFAAPVTLHQDRQPTSHSYAAMAFDAAGALHTVWIDGRDKLAATTTATTAGGTASYRGATLYHNVSLDGGASFGPDLRLSDHSCECCRIALSPTADGRVALLWRHVSAPNIRDHAFMLLPGADNAAATPVRASYDNWAVDGCPHHGPALTPAADGGYHAVWFGVRDGLAQVRYGRLDRSGAPLGAAQALPDSQAEHADILASGARLAIVWRSYDGSATHLRAWLSDDDGRHFTLRELASSGADNGYPQLLQKNGRLFVIWNTTEERHVEAL